MTIDLRLGRWQDVLADVECDALIADAPYSPRVHAGQRTGSSTRKATLNYLSITESECAKFVESWTHRVRHWFVMFSDHQARTWWEQALESVGWYVFAPVVWLRENPTPRLAGDGPTSACDYITVARPRRRLSDGRIGSRPGYYRIAGNDGRENGHPGSKPLDAMRRIVRDYSIAGDVIADPFSGSATTLLAAAMEGRRAVGCEMDSATFAKAQARIARGYTPTLFDADRPMVQRSLLGSDE